MQGQERGSDGVEKFVCKLLDSLSSLFLVFPVCSLRLPSRFFYPSRRHRPVTRLKYESVETYSQVSQSKTLGVCHLVTNVTEVRKVPCRPVSRWGHRSRQKTFIPFILYPIKVETIHLE